MHIKFFKLENNLKTNYLLQRELKGPTDWVQSVRFLDSRYRYPLYSFSQMQNGICDYTIKCEGVMYCYKIYLESVKDDSKL